MCAMTCSLELRFSTQMDFPSISPARSAPLTAHCCMELRRHFLENLEQLLFSVQQPRSQDNGRSCEAHHSPKDFHLKPPICRTLKNRTTYWSHSQSRNSNCQEDDAHSVANFGERRNRRRKSARQSNKCTGRETKHNCKANCDRRLLRWDPNCEFRYPRQSTCHDKHIPPTDFVRAKSRS